MQNAECRMSEDTACLGLYSFANFQVIFLKWILSFAELIKSKRFSVFLNYALCIMHSTFFIVPGHSFIANC